MRVFLRNIARHQKRWFARWHLYLGLGAGVIVAIVGLTGSILVFRDEIDQALNPALLRVEPRGLKLSFDRIVPLIKAQRPALKFQYLYDEQGLPDTPYQLYETKTRSQVYVDPYSGRILGERNYESSFIGFTLRLHRTLLIPAAGRYLVGLSALTLLILTISGLRLWIPKKWKQLRAGLTVNFRAGFKRQNYDWHNVLGLYSAPVVSLLSLTGFCITFSAAVIPVLFLLSFQSPKSLSNLLNPKSAWQKGAKPVPLSEVLATGLQAVPGSTVRGLFIPDTVTGAYRIDLSSPGKPKSGERDLVIVDQFTGKILFNTRTELPNIGRAYLSWLTPVHYGTFGGRPTQVLALIGSFMPFVLCVTGFIIWYPRWKKSDRRRRPLPQPDLQP